MTFDLKRRLVAESLGKLETATLIVGLDADGLAQMLDCLLVEASLCQEIAEIEMGRTALRRQRQSFPVSLDRLFDLAELR